MTYIPTPEQIAAVVRMDAERKAHCQRILERYEAERKKLLNAHNEKQEQAKKFKEWASK